MVDNIGSSDHDGSIKEQDRLLPIANVGRIMKQILPTNAKISKEAKETMQECVSEFISFVTSEASEKCRKERRKTVNGDDVCSALSSLGFDDYAGPLKRYLHRYRELEGDRAINQDKLSNDEEKGEPSSYQDMMNLHNLTQFTRKCYYICRGGGSQKLYDQYKKIYEDYITFKVLPSLREKQGESLLQELVKRWDNHKLMTRWLSRFFHELDRLFVVREKVPSLNAASYLIFYKMVYEEMNDQVRNAVLFLINREREGEQIDQALVDECFSLDIQVDECLKQERERVSSYLHQRSEQKLLEVVEHELRFAFAKLEL